VDWVAPITRSMLTKVLLGVAYKYGKDSEEYEMAGGVRKSKRKRPVRAVPTTESYSLKLS
jgi:hypothetical protein